MMRLMTTLISSDAPRPLANIGGDNFDLVASVTAV